jgi:hypothetical protein
MHRIVGGVLALLLALPGARAGDEPKGKPATPREQYNALVKENQDQQQAFSKAFGAAKTQEERDKIIKEKYPKPEKLAPRFLELAEKNPKDPAALDALAWVVNNDRGTSGKDNLRGKALAQLGRDHVQSEKVGLICANMANQFDKDSEAFLRAVLEKNPHPKVQSEACLALAQFLRQRAEAARQFKGNPELVKAYGDFIGKEAVADIQKADPAKLEAEGGRYLEEFADKYLKDKSADDVRNLCQTLARGSDKGSEAFLRRLLEKDSRRDVQGVACLSLAQVLKERADGLGREGSKDAAKVRHESEAVFERAAKEFADVQLPFRGTVGDKAKAELFEVRHLAIGLPAPEVEGEDLEGQKFKLSDYKGKVVLLDFWGNW